MDLALPRDAPDYPLPLLALRTAPPWVFVRGVMSPLSPAVAIVGARRASDHGRRLARRIAFELARAGVLVVSGGALGIDSAAHEGALDGGGRTIVVLPTPLGAPAPRENLRLFARVLARGGAWVTEQEHPVGRWAFCKRNRLIAALGELTLVIEAGARSGTRHTAEAALALGRPVAAVPWGVGDPRGEGCVALLRRGARVVTSAADVLALLDPAPVKPLRSPARGAGQPPGRPSPGPPATVEGRELRVLALVEEGVQDVHVLSRSAGIDVPTMLSLLTGLELEGLISVRGGRVVRLG